MAWMAWTGPTALFFVFIGSSLIAMTVWELWRPTVLRKGILPIETTRGDRFFISLLSAAFIHLCWMGLVGEPVLPATGISVVVALGLMRWG